MADQLPKGFRAAGVAAGLKSDPEKLDLSLFASDLPCVAVGVYTQNLVFAAPVKLCRARTPSDNVKAVVVNSGNANACTGEQGDRDAELMAAETAAALGAEPKQVLVMSTGVIGKLMPMDKIVTGVRAVSGRLSSNEESLLNAARGMMTTDTKPKTASRVLQIDGTQVTVCGVAKGAAMIGPNMATMLSLVMTDARLEAVGAQSALLEAVDESFNCIGVDGHMSTNDTVLLLANGAAGTVQLGANSLAKFGTALSDVCEDLAQAIPADGEGATHFVTIEVHGCKTRGDATQIAKTIANSPLVKTAIAGNDPNWGRIVSAAGYAGVKFNPKKVCLHLNESLLYERGQPAPFDGDAVSRAMAANRNVHVVLLLAEGEASARFWTCDLTSEYVRLNADYTT